MRIICDTGLLTDVCLNVQRCIPAKAVLPHIEGILIRTAGESAIELSGFDLDLGVTTTLQVNVERAGAAVLNAKTFCDILRHLPGDTPSATASTSASRSTSSASTRCASR